MGFFSIATEVILQEHKFRPITGRVLMIGRQNTGLTPDQARQMIVRNGIRLRTNDFELDKTTIHATQQDGEISDRAFFAAFSDCKVEAIDVSEYEGAEIIHDLSVPIPDHLRGQFDFIYDGSSLDNIFNVATAMQNIHELLKPGGRMVLFNWSNSAPTAYTMISPDWFMDFFAYHEYEDAKVLAVECGDGFGRIWQYNPILFQSDQYGNQCSSIVSKELRNTICFAEKSNRPGKTGFPVQVHYRGENTEPYLSSCKRFSESKRPAYDFIHHGSPNSRPTISSIGSVSLLADSDRDYDARLAREAAELAKPLNRIKSAVREKRIASGIKRRLTSLL